MWNDGKGREVGSSCSSVPDAAASYTWVAAVGWNTAAGYQLGATGGGALTTG